MPSKKKQHSDNGVPNKIGAYLPQTHTQPLADRLAAGKALRQTNCSRSAHAEWTPPAHRRDPIELLIESSAGRLENLLPIRYARMAANPFAFYRGAAAIMAYDLSHTPNTGLNIQICGDCHLLNFGGFATAERRLIFDINDFDETSIAPWEWDVKRLTASFVVAGRQNGFDAASCHEAAWTAAQSYRQHIAEYASMSVLDAWYDALDLAEVIATIKNKDNRRFYTSKLEEASEQSAHEKEFAKLAYATGEAPRILDQPPLIFHYAEMENEQHYRIVTDSLDSYIASLSPERQILLSRYELKDVAFKVVGVGSVGTFCAICLFMSGGGDPLFIQTKEARQSVLEQYAGASSFAHHGQRVVVGQRLMQAAGDLFLGWFTSTGSAQRHFYVRQLRDAKVKPIVEMMKPSDMASYAELCGRALARAHVRSGDAAILSGYMGKSAAFEDALADFSVAYADQNERDHAQLIEAIRAGRVPANFSER
jgi:uncharacterized protein (DUF2252 family)